MDETGQTVDQVDLGPDARGYRDGPVNALAGTRTYRVAAIGRDGNVSGADQRPVSFRTSFKVSFREPADPARSRFRVTWKYAGQTAAEEFLVARGDEIGGTVPGEGDRPEFDLRTGWRFRGIRGQRRTEEPRKAKVPMFTPGGSLFTDPRSGTVVFEEWEVPLVRTVLGADVTVTAADGTKRDLWLEKAKD